MKRILFVDDEPRILEGLQNMLHRQRRKWDMVFALGGENGLKALEKDAFDVIVTDMRMPGIDGAALLREVQENHKNTVRIVLSGYTELEAALRIVPVAHQFLTKPCKPEILENVVERACNLQVLVSNEALLKIIGKIEKLPPLPRMYTALTNALANPDTGAGEISKILEQDMAMCAKLLQLVNSSFFASAMKISNIQFAVVRLGFQTIKNLALSLELFQSDIPTKVTGFSVEKLQKQALLTANIARGLLSEKQHSDDAFMAAMLHDIGMLILATELSDDLEEAVYISRSEKIPLHAAEEKVFGVTHAEIGAYLLGVWGLPYPIVEAVANHHRPSRVPSQHFDTLAAVYVADYLRQEAENVQPPPTLDHEYLKNLGVLDQLDTWRKLSLKQVVTSPKTAFA
ncbi:MAG: HDOD domain-containing protein [Nitrospiria bacterium]